MSDSGESHDFDAGPGDYQQETYSQTWDSHLSIDETAIQNVEQSVSGNQCDEDGCSLGDHPAQQYWEKLMSAVPVEDFAESGHIRPKNIDRLAAPKEEHFSTIVEAMRPSGCSDHALDRIGVEWDLKVYTAWQDFPDELKSKAEELSLEWVGDDFDAFAESITDTIGLAEGILDDVDGVMTLLNSEQENIFSLQGGYDGQVPFPSPQFYTEDNWFCEDEVHCRPPWWDEGTCRKINPEDAIYMVGVDPSYLNEVNSAIDARYQDLVEYHQEQQQLHANNPQSYYLTPSDEALRQQARSEILTETDEFQSQVRDDYQQASQENNDDIVGRSNDMDRSLSRYEDPTEPRQPALSDGGSMPDDGGYGGVSDPPTPSVPSGSGAGLGDAGGYSPPAGVDTPTPPDGSSLNPPGSSGVGGTGGIGSDNPWSSGISDPDDVSGGLASGGSFSSGSGLGGAGGSPGGAGGGLGGGAGGPGAGPGGVGGMMGAGGAGRGAGAGAGGRGAGGMKGAGAGAGGAGRGGGGRGGGMGGMMGGGGRGMGGAGENQDGKDTWLVEDDDVWGIGNEDEDPYA
ncbi:hypothetical protein L0U85_00665 [Glycomyces sp. L485]|uniref:hypothetical protein n=1 Tax=Glycomyces sp. L485 TaxID=2909235 RepID=UPI001F4B3B61|nr:hypothetical protein [Glycomyces sp. L485]MCH7229381.1 hypothetical protein [Glycomyces sp. L485]